MKITDRFTPPLSMRRKSLLLTLLACLTIGIIVGIASIPAIAAFGLAHDFGYRPATYRVRLERSVTVTAADGTALVGDIYHPQTQEPTPTVLVRIPYSKTLRNTLFSRTIGYLWASRGYTTLIQGTRGRYESGGRYTPFIHETGDGQATLDWISHQPWYDGQVAMWGGSYFGYTQWVLAHPGNPQLAALIPQICSTSFYRMFYPGGAFSLESALFWATLSYGDRDIALAQEDIQKGYEGVPLIEADDRAVQDIDFFNDWAGTPNATDAYWQQVDGDERVKSLNAPALLMAGWYDPFLPSQLDDFQKIRAEADADIAAATRLVIGPWTHARTVTFPDGVTPRNYRLESIEPSIPWFDKHLSPFHTDASAKNRYPSPVRIYVMGANEWRDEQEWPLARTHDMPFYLHSGGHANGASGDGWLRRDPVNPSEEGDSEWDRFIYDPTQPVSSAGGTMLGSRSGIALQNEIEAREDVLNYTTPPLPMDTEITGPIQLILYVSTTAPNTDFTAKLVDVYPDDGAYNVSDGILRRDYPATAIGNASSSSIDESSVTEIQIDLWPTSQVFRQGHRIRLEVSSSNYPRFDRNPNTGQFIPTEEDVAIAHQTIYHTDILPSRLILPLIPASSSP
ncbi:MAG: CocE/NonD family hydrolase [Cyanobacteria bacterium P01_E01_bin.6]